jgi:D-amino-acid dehydrogenase
MNQIIVIGGGIVGLSCAYYLRQAGSEVTVLEQGDFLDNCSYGNMGYVCPSHFIPLASPGKVRQGIKWMFNAQSPFYIRPALNPDLIDWGLKFMRSANVSHVKNAAVPLRDISLLSQNEYRNWNSLPEFNFALEQKGLLEIFRTPAMRHHAEETVRTGRQLGLDVELLEKNQLHQMEPETSIDALGAVYFKSDSHLYPNKLMPDLREVLREKGVRLLPHQTVARLERHNGNITQVATDKEEFRADQVVVAAGSWSKKLAALAEVSFPLMPGRGYSITVEKGGFQLRHPALLMERSVALTPMNSTTMRFGGTMEVVPVGTPPRYRRVQGILNAVNEYFPDAHLQMPPTDKIWYGYRPCSADGLPYIGRTKKCSNLLIATGHSMLGLSLGAGTGKLIAEIANEQTPSIDMTPFTVERFN